MEEFKIDEADLVGLEGKVVVITGGSTGIGLATTELLLSLGSFVVVGGNNPPAITHPHLSFIKTDVTVWTDLVALFQRAHAQHHRIDHVFANSGICRNEDYFISRYDSEGNLAEPSHQTIDVNVRGLINTCYIAMDYLRTQQDPPGGSVVCNASSTSFQRFGAVDYSTSKHAVLGYMRGVALNVQTRNLPIRINAVAPGWTLTNMVSQEDCDALGVESQPASAVARTAALVMADSARNGQVIYSTGGRFYEIENSVLLPAAMTVMGGPEKSEEAALRRAQLSRTEAALQG